jgi:hypothetical protein
MIYSSTLSTEYDKIFGLLASANEFIRGSDPTKFLTTYEMMKSSSVINQGFRGNFEKSGRRRSMYAFFPSLASSVP